MIDPHEPSLPPPCFGPLGRIVNVGSVFGSTVAPLYGAYSASKFALNAITDAPRMELQP
jgi:short-subunit dehydrogenase